MIKLLEKLSKLGIRGEENLPVTKQQVLVFSS